jgi:SRSO17 transposase
MKTKASIKSKAFISKFQTRLDLNKSGIKCFVSAIRKNVFPGAIKNQIEEKQKNSLLHEDPVVRCSKGQWRIKKLEFSIKCGFESIVSTYNNFFRAGQKTQQDKAQQYLEGIFCAERGKRNIERMVEEVSGSEYESLQHFISNSPWDSEGLMLELAKNVSRKLQPCGKIGCTVDEKAHLKKGTKSVGVARQYAGTSGKVDNCQVAVYLSLTAGKYSSLTNFRLFLPQQWIDDPIRCQKAGIPEHKMVFKTKPQLALDMIREHIHHGVQFDYINGDGLYGNGFEFSKGLASLGVNYILETHYDQLIFTQEPRIAVPDAEPGKRGRQPSLPKSDSRGITIEEYAKSLRKSDFKEVRIRPTTKGWLTARIHVTTVWVWDKKSGDRHAIEQTLVIRSPLDNKDKTKYSLSNIPVDKQSVEEFAFMQAQRFWIERCFRDNSHDLGMSDYQVRTYKGFFNHMTLTCVALEWVLTERLENSGDIPLLSVNDIRILIAKEIRSRVDYNCIEKRGEQLEKRHRQRQKDINRYYELNLPK